MRSKKASLIINPRTGQNVAKLPDVLAVLSAAGWKTKIALKEYGKHVMELARKASDGKRELVIAYGGDGTLNQVVNGVMSVKGKRSVVAVMPGGTANVWAGEIGVPTEPVKAALALVNSEERKVDVGRVEVYSLTFPGEQPTLIAGKIKKKATRDSRAVRHHFLLMAGLGIDAAVMGAVSKPLKYRIGPLAVGLSAMKEMPAQHAFPIEIRALGSDTKKDMLWKGDALQIVLGNTRRYAKVATLTPNAYIDDGILDVCVITSGDALTTVQQFASLLLRLKPDTTTAEYFHGAHLLITVPSTVLFQVDGSPVKLKDYLSNADYKKLQQAQDKSQVMVTYQVDSVPHALQVAIPCTYNDELFEHTAEQQQSVRKQHIEEGSSPIKVYRAKDEDNPETPLQQKTVALESQPQSLLNRNKEDDEQAQKHVEEMRKELPAFADALLEHGQRIVVVGKAPNPAQKQTYIIAGGLQRPITGETIPVAVVVNSETDVFNREGHRVNDLAPAVHELVEGAVIVVEGKRSKRGVIHARRLVL